MIFILCSSICIRNLWCTGSIYLSPGQWFFSENASSFEGIACDQRSTHFTHFSFGRLLALPEEINQFDSLSPSGAYIICICVGVCEFEWSSRNQLVCGAKKRTSVGFMWLLQWVTALSSAFPQMLAAPQFLQYNFQQNYAWKISWDLQLVTNSSNF